MSLTQVIKKPKRNSDNVILKGTLLITSTLTVMAGATIAPVLPTINTVFEDVPNVDLLVRLVLTLPALFIALGAPFAGTIIDRFGRKRLLIASVLLYGIAGSAGFVLEDIFMLLLSRALLGIAVAGVMTSVTTLIADYYVGQARSSFLGLQAAFAGMGGVVYLTLGGFLAENSWHDPFLIYLVAFIILPFVVTTLYEPVVEKSKNTHTSEISAIRGNIPIGLVTFIYVTMIVTQVIFYSIPVQLPFYLENLIGASSSQSGLAIAALSLFYSIASLSFRWVDQQLNHLYTLLLGFALTGTGLIILAIANIWLIIGLGLIVSGFGLGLIVPNLITWLTNTVPEHIRGRSLGGLTTALFLGQFLSPFILTPIGNATGDSGTYLILGLFLIAVTGIEFLLRKPITTLTNKYSEEQ